MSMKIYSVTLGQNIRVEAISEEDAEKKAIEMCANDSEILMPSNMFIEATREYDATLNY